MGLVLFLKLLIESKLEVKPALKEEACLSVSAFRVHGLVNASFRAFRQLQRKIRISLSKVRRKGRIQPKQIGLWYASVKLRSRMATPFLHFKEKRSRISYIFFKYKEFMVIFP